MTFHNFLSTRSAIESSEQIRKLEADCHEFGTVRAFQALYMAVWAMVMASLKEGSVSFWYDDAQNAERYTALHRVVLPSWDAMTRTVAEAMCRSLLQSSGRVFALDVGTGDGNLACTLSRMLPSEERARVTIMASDRSEAMLHANAERFQAHGIVVVPQGDLRANEWRESELYRACAADFDGFTAIGAMGAMQMVPDRNRLFSGAYNLLKSGGGLAFCHDFLAEGEMADRYGSAYATISAGWESARKEGSRVTLAGFIAGFIYRRFVLSGDRLLTREEESRKLMTAGFRPPTIERFRNPEFSVLSTRR